MKTISFLENPDYGEFKPKLSVLTDTPFVKEIRIVFRAGQELKEHKSAYPISVAVVKGAINFGSGNERIVLEEGKVVLLEADVLHDLIANEDSVVRLSVHKPG